MATLTVDQTMNHQATPIHCQVYIVAINSPSEAKLPAPDAVGAYDMQGLVLL